MSKINFIRLTQRDQLRSTIATQITIANEFRSSQHIEIDVAETLVSKFNDFRTRVTQLNDQIVESLEENSEIETEIRESTDIDNNILDTVSMLNSKIKAQNNLNTSVQNTPGLSSVPNIFNSTLPPPHTNKSVNLPKLQITKFSGDALKFQEFWDSFSTTIHENTDLATVDKLKYLRSFLIGDALSTVQGYRITAENYEPVIEALKEKYGDKQVAIFSHFEALLSLPNASHDTQQLQTTYDECEQHIRSLIALGLEEDTFGQVFTPIILSKLPIYVKIELHRRNGSNKWTLQNLRKMLKEEIKARNMSSSLFAQHSKASNKNIYANKANTNKQSSSKNTQGGTLATLLNNSTKVPKCYLCSGQHYTDECTDYPDNVSRKSRLKGRCFICLSKKHATKDCPNPRPCYHCKKPTHNRCLCPSKGQANSATEDTSLTVSSTEDPFVPEEVNPTLLSHGETVILQTALAEVKGKFAAPVRFLFDTGCSRTFITTKVAKKIGAISKGKEIISTAGFADTKRKTVEYNIVEIDVLLKDGTKKTVTANVTPTISCPIRKVPIDVQKYPIASQLVLAEPILKTSQLVEIDILIGNDYYCDFVGTERIRCKDGLIFMSSSLGFIATGRITSEKDENPSAATLVMTHRTAHDFEVGIERYWSLEDIGIKPPRQTSDDEEAIKAFNKSVVFKDNRYSVSWPYQEEIKELPDNKTLAYVRFKSLVKKISSNTEIFEKYNQIINEQEQKGIIEQIPNDAPSEHKIHYLPHHCVVKPDRATTKVRIVYDASAKLSKSSPSLNECVYRGPVILEDICGLIIRFRLHKIAITSDIEKAFLQIGLNSDSKDVTRFFWMKDPTKPLMGNNLITYRFLRVIFGVKPSPFMLSGTVKHHLNTYDDSDAAKEIDKNTYVDNVFSGNENVKDAQGFYKEAKAMFHDASMNLREWSSNSSAFIKSIPEVDRGKGPITKVLGLAWNTIDDTLACSSFSIQESSVNTKRLMLKYLAKVFDPCGFFAAVTIKGKILIQRLWKAKFDWDDEVSDELRQEWSCCSRDLQQIHDYKIPRQYNVPGNLNKYKVELHAFCDASSKAYCSVIYLRVIKPNNVSSSLVFAKSRVAPLQAMTIPKLELMAALIGTRLLSFVEKELRIAISSKYLWSDSKCVLHWLLKKELTSTFVKNRVTEIRTHKDITFRYVPTADNPADLATRGVTYDEIVSNKVWWHGPEWFCCSESMWPANIDSKVSEDESEDTVDNQIHLELQSNVLTLDVKTVENNDLLPIDRYSSLKKLLRVTAWIFRFIDRVRKTSQVKGPLLASELSKAEFFWQQKVQEEGFPNMFDKTNKNKKLFVQQLGVHTDEEGLLRCSTRLNHADLPFETKYPLLLPKKHYFSRLVTKGYHQKLFHAGVSHTLSALRSQYWIPHGRVLVKSIIKECMICRKSKTGPYQAPPFPPLPNFRLSETKPFTNVGIDYLGPLFIKPAPGSNEKQKVWICLFTCAVVRAIHLEVVENLTTECFLLCLRRFCAIYSTPKLIITDNAKQFHSSNRFLNKTWNNILTNDEVQNYVAQKRIEWKFVTERAPWMGGFYERMVGIVKKSMKNCLDSKFVNITELQTVLAEVSAVVNNRPLLYVEDDICSPMLTPSHFLGGPKVFLVPPLNKNSSPNEVKPNSLILQWKRINAALSNFWQIWRTQYLLGLRNATSFKDKNTSSVFPQVGSVVLVKDNLPRNQWKMAIIVELKTGTDGKYRSVTLKLPNKNLINRPIRLLYPLEITACPGVNDGNKPTNSHDDSNSNKASVEM